MSEHGNDNQGKRGFVRPQQSRPPVKATPADWEQAKAAFEAALQDHNSAHETNAPSALTDQTLAAWRAARDRLMSTPAPNGEALAFKINWAVSYVDSYCTDFAREAASIMREGEPAEKAMLACYLDALALSGVSRPAEEDEKPATIPEAAAVDFEAWPADKLQPYTPHSWAELWNPWGISLAIASNVMGQSKAELTKLAKDTGALTHEGGQFYELAQSLQRTREAFSDAVTMLQAAELRMMIAAAAANVAAGYVEEGE